MSLGFSIGDFITVSQLAWQVYESCRGAPKEFQELSAEIQALHDVLLDLETCATMSNIDAALQTRLQARTKGAEAVLLEIRELLGKRAALSTKRLQVFDRLRWSRQKVMSLRIRLIYESNLLLSCYHSHARALHSRNQAILEQKFDRLQLQMDRFPLPRSVASSQEPIQNLVEILIPSFFLPQACSPKKATFNHEQIRATIGTQTVQFSWLLLVLHARIGQPSAELDFEIQLKTARALPHFQKMFPDKEGFRYTLINRAIMYSHGRPDKVNTIDLAATFLIISFLMSHSPSTIRYEEHVEAEWSPDSDISTNTFTFLYFQMKYTLANLLRKTLRKVLRDLDILMQRGSKAEWPTVIFTLCLVLFAVESMTVDIYLHSWTLQESEAICQDIEYNAIFLLVERFKQSTSGLNPLDLNWNLMKNKAMLDGDAQAVQGFKYLQQISDKKWDFLKARRTACFDWENTDSLTGRYVSGLFLENV